MKPVLVVDDDLAITEAVAEILVRSGHDPICVHTGADALAFLGRVGVPCKVLLDLHVPDTSGWEVLSTLRASSRHHDVVIMSGATSDHLPRGVPVLRKPFTAAQLIGAIG